MPVKWYAVVPFVCPGEPDTTAGVAVVFDEEDEGEDDYGYSDMEAEGEDEDDEETEEQEEKEKTYLAAKNLDEEEVDSSESAYSVDVSKIDPHWLQRELNAVFSDPNQAVATEKEILSILPIPDIQECENKLVLILKYENFELAKKILKNRWKLFYCIRLGQAQTTEEKDGIREEMKNTQEGQEVLELLDALTSRRNKEKEVTLNVRKEAATLAAKAQVTITQTHPMQARGASLGKIFWSRGSNFAVELAAYKYSPSCRMEGSIFRSSTA